MITIGLNACIFACNKSEKNAACCDKQAAKN
jgi:hypothetical protein